MDMVTRIIVTFVFVAVVGCGGNDESVPADARGDAAADAATDGPGVDAPVDASGAGVVCDMPGQECSLPAQACCDVNAGTDMCIQQGGNCSGVPMMCDGPEDCPAAQECCLFEGQNARCLDDGICGTTGSISDVMCHTPADCPVGLDSCCGTAAGPVLDLYFVCRSGPCPQ